MDLNFAFHIPTWAFWVVGIPVGAIILAFAWVGFMFIKNFKVFR